MGLSRAAATPLLGTGCTASLQDVREKHRHAGTSFFAAFEIPARQGTVSITVASYVIGHNPDAWHILYPALILLDREFKPVRELDAGDAGWRTAEMFQTSG